MEQIVMTPKCKTANSTTLIIERKRLTIEPNPNGSEKDVHIAGGDHKGIVINKHMITESDDSKPAHISLQFKVFLVSAQSQEHTQEQRTLNFWFYESLPDDSRPSISQEFFRELVTPQEFPRDYVGYIKKIMKLIQHKYPAINRVEVEMKKIEEYIELPIRPLSNDESVLEGVQFIELSSEKILELIESAYPNPLTIQSLAENHGWNNNDIKEKLCELQNKGLIVLMENGAFTRVVQQDVQIQVVKQMPIMASSKQPTIAIITAQYCEKLAVDSMMENKETFVRYTTVGESNVYTLGDIGAHRIVCTKLPTVGHTREAMTAAGNTTTRLLGTFQKVDFVFLVGVAGGVPHYTDYKRHVRLGDVVISYPTKLNNTFVYIYCENAKEENDGIYIFETKEYCPANLRLQEIAANLLKQVRKEIIYKMRGLLPKAKPKAITCFVKKPLRNNTKFFSPEDRKRSLQVQLVIDNEGLNPPWQNYFHGGFKNLASQSEHNFEAPPAESDKLYMNIGERDVIEVSHPSAPKGNTTYARNDGCPQIHLAPIASGRRIARDDQLRQKFASRYGILAFDTEMDAVVESIQGNCRDSFAIVRGIVDYKDGTRNKEWQPYASLAAASVVKAMIYAMDPPSPTKK